MADSVFRQVVTNNSLYALGAIPVSVCLALLMAVWANWGLPGRGIVRATYFTSPTLLTVAAANIWLLFYTTQIGILDRICGLDGGAFAQMIGGIPPMRLFNRHHPARAWRAFARRSKPCSRSV